MSTGVTISGLEEAAEYLEGIPPELFGQSKEILKQRTFSAQRKVTNNLRGGSLQSRSGQLRKSIRTQNTGTDLDSLRSGIFSKGVIYAPLQEYGDKVTAKNAYKNVPGGPYLNIPTDANKTASGVMRKSARDVFSEGGFIVKFKSGGYGVMLDDELMFTLHREVEVPARLGMRDAMAHEIPILLSNLKDIQL